MLLKKIKIKNLTFTNIVLAPMASITDYPFRKIVLNYGCGLVISEMVSAKSLLNSNPKSLSMIEVRDDRPLAIQIFGGDVQSMVWAAHLCEEKGADMIEINTGCPVKKIVKAGAGIALFKQPKKLATIVSEIAKRIKIPISVKLRLGISRSDECIEVAKVCQDSGASIIHLHMRTAQQLHSGKPDLQATRRLKESIKIPLIANGGIKTPQDAIEVFEKTSADAISIARGAVINPFIFSEITDFIEKGSYEKKDIYQKIELFMEYLKLSSNIKGEINAINSSKKLIGLWLSGFAGAKDVRNRYMKIKSLEEAYQIFNELITKLKHSVY